MADPVGVLEIADRLGVQAATAHRWLQMDKTTAKLGIPEPTYPSVNGSRAWEWPEILRWAGETGRLKSASLQMEFRRRFSKDPVPPRKGGAMSKLSPEEQLEIAGSSTPAKELAARFGVSEAHIYKIRREARKTSAATG